MPQVSAAVLRSAPSSTSASASIRRAAALSFSPLAALRSSEAVRSSRVIDTAAPIDAAPLKSQHRVRVSLIWESLMSHSFGPLVLGVGSRSGHHPRGLFHDGEAYAGLVAVLFRDLPPTIFGFLARLERTFDLGRAFDELVEVHRAELAADHPEIAACSHGSLLLLADFTQPLEP